MNLKLVSSLFIDGTSNRQSMVLLGGATMSSQIIPFIFHGHLLT